MLGLFSGDNTGDLGLGEAVLGLEFLLTFMIVLAYLRVSNQDNISSECQYKMASGDRALARQSDGRLCYRRLLHVRRHQLQGRRQPRLGPRQGLRGQQLQGSLGKPGKSANSCPSQLKGSSASQTSLVSLIPPYAFVPLLL